jgi:hypothetical protein
MSGQTRLPSLKAEGMVDETRSTSIKAMRDTMFVERLLQLMNNGQPPENQDQESRRSQDFLGHDNRQVGPSFLVTCARFVCFATLTNAWRIRRPLGWERRLRRGLRRSRDTRCPLAHPIPTRPGTVS